MGDKESMSPGFGGKPGRLNWPSANPRANRPRPYNRSVPTYEYACASCGTHVEVYQRFSDEPLTECGVCGGPLRKVFHPAGILFKGTGFYKTDSRSSRRSTTAGGSDADSKTAAAGTDSKTPAGTGSKTSGGEAKKTAAGSGSGSSNAGGKEQSA
jgi:putative FmdB family regulatory protein